MNSSWNMISFLKKKKLNDINYINFFRESIQDQNFKEKVEKIQRLINAKKAIIYETSAVEKNLDLQFSKDVRVDIVKRILV